MFGVDVLAGRPREEGKSYAKRIESHPETGIYPQKHAGNAGVFIVATGRVIGQVERKRQLPGLTWSQEE